jgi:L-fuconolactonase
MGRKETPTMPDVPIVDAHLHLWDPNHFRMPWLDGNALLDQRYDLADFRAATTGLDVQGMVYVQTDVAEPFAPLEYGERARAYLDALRAISPLIKGVRRIYQSAPVDFCLQPDFVRGVQLLPDYGLSFDLCLAHRHLANTVQLVRQCPNTAFMLDHLAKPEVAGRLLDPWRDQLEQLAGCPNVYCKISGVVTEAQHNRWSIDDVKPYVLHALAVFGADRVVFGGDWPVVLQAAPYRRWVEVLDSLTGDRSPEARRKLWAENAVRFYRL